jgi:hypothetical protein
MVDFSKLRTEQETTHLFIPMGAMPEVRWLLDMNNISQDDCCMRPCRMVLSHLVPEIKHVSDKQRDAEINKLYGEDAKYVKPTPAVIISHYNVDDLTEALSDTLLGDGDADYNAYKHKRQEEIDKEGFPDEEGIFVMSDED